MGLMTGMQKTLKKEAKPQFEETQAGKKMKDPELEALLAEEVFTSDGKKIKVLNLTNFMLCSTYLFCF